MFEAYSSHLILNNQQRTHLRITRQTHKKLNELKVTTCNMLNTEKIGTKREEQIRNKINCELTHTHSPWNDLFLSLVFHKRDLRRALGSMLKFMAVFVQQRFIIKISI